MHVTFEDGLEETKVGGVAPEEGLDDQLPKEEAENPVGEPPSSPEPGADQEDQAQAVTKDGSTKGDSLESQLPESKKRELADLLDLSSVDNVIKMFKLREQYSRPLSQQERQAKGAIAANRCVYEVDQFVKLSEVR